jgi:hypothetical protein
MKGNNQQNKNRLILENIIYFSVCVVRTERTGSADINLEEKE